MCLCVFGETIDAGLKFAGEAIVIKWVWVKIKPPEDDRF